MKLQEMIEFHTTQKALVLSAKSFVDSPSDTLNQAVEKVDEIYGNTIAALNDLQKAINDIYKVRPCSICKNFCRVPTETCRACYTDEAPYRDNFVWRNDHKAKYKGDG